MKKRPDIVLYVNEVESKAWPDEDICERWGKIYALPPIVQRWQKGELISDAQVCVV